MAVGARNAASQNLTSRWHKARCHAYQRQAKCQQAPHDCQLRVSTSLVLINPFKYLRLGLGTAADRQRFADRSCRVRNRRRFLSFHFLWFIGANGSADHRRYA